MHITCVGPTVRWSILVDEFALNSIWNRSGEIEIAEVSCLLSFCYNQVSEGCVEVMIVRSKMGREFINAVN